MVLQQVINQLIQLLQEYSPLPPEFTVEAIALRDRLSAGQFHLAVLGQFKRGKSTLINALLGADILPSGVLPVTLVPVFLRFGPQPDLEIHYHNGHQPEHHPLDKLGDFVNETNNPKNLKDVSQVDLHYPTRLLQNGIVLIDTPGVGSTLQHNTDTTLDFLPHCDAGIVVLSADPPITAAEVTFLRQLQPHVTRLFFVLNKADYLDEKGAAEAGQFLRETLRSSLGTESPLVFTVSARQGLQARLKSDEQAWTQSGMAALEQTLLDFAANGKQVALTEAVQRKATNLVLRADQLLALERQAMLLPLEELETKITAFKSYADTADQQRQEIIDRLAGDQARLMQRLEAATIVLREKAQDVLAPQAVRLGSPTHDTSRVKAFHGATQEFFDQERSILYQQFREALTRILVEPARRAQEVREDLRWDAASLLDIPHFPLLGEETVVDLAEPAWTIEYLLVQVTPTFIDKWLPRTLQMQRSVRQRDRLVRELAVQNAEKVRWWILRTIDESVRNFQQRIKIELEETIQQIDQALQAGYRRRQSQAEDQQAVLTLLTTYRQHLDQLRQAFEEPMAVAMPIAGKAEG